MSGERGELKGPNSCVRVHRLTLCPSALCSYDVAVEGGFAFRTRRRRHLRLKDRTADESDALIHEQCGLDNWMTLQRTSIDKNSRPSADEPAHEPAHQSA